MYYVTLKQSPRYHQISLDELLFDTGVGKSYVITNNESNTKTITRDMITFEMVQAANATTLIKLLSDFNQKFDYLRQVPRGSLYREFPIPKKSGGVRIIDAPNDELKEALYALKAIFENYFVYTKNGAKLGALYHTSAFAYVKKRCAVDAVKKHQQNESRWFAKFDFSNFFGSTTLDFVMHQLEMIFPFCVVCDNPFGKEELRKAVELAFLNGGLPQGTPISPLITNIIMIPIDYMIANDMRDFNKQRFVYTRYADDIIISSKYDFKVDDITAYIHNVLKEFDAPYKLKDEKTRYGSSAGRNFNLGVMLNKDNKITIGSKRKRQFEVMLSNFIMDTKNGRPWDPHEVQVLDGYCNYYKSVEGEVIDNIVKHIGDKFGVNVRRLIKEVLTT